MNKIITREWSIIFFPSSVYTYGKKFILRVIYISETIFMSIRSNYMTPYDSYGLPWLYTTVRTNEFLRRYGDYQSTRCYPISGSDLVYLLWGGFSIGNATLQRFYSLHFTLPFIIFMLSILHFALLHEYGSNTH